MVNLVRNYRSTPQVVGCANRLAGPARHRGSAPGGPPRLVAAAAPAAAPAPSSPSTTTRRPRRAAVARAGGQLHRCRGAAAPDGGAGPGQRADRAVRARVRRARACPARCAGPSGSSTGPRCARRPGCCAAASAVRDRPEAGRGRTGRPQVRHILAGLGLTAEPPAGRAPPGSAGSRWRRWPSSPRTTLCRRSRRRPRRGRRRAGPPGRDRARPAAWRG